MTDDLEWLRQAYQNLPEPERRVFDLARFEGLGYSEIAEALGITADEVERRLVDAVARLTHG